jgi:peptidoglycan/LPS O-acetylase OafA/YrhL
MFKTRILATWLNYAVAVGVFAVANIVLGTGVPVVRMLATLTCFRAIGNPTWYIFCILSCYLASFVAAKATARFPLGRVWSLFVLALLILGYYLFALRFGKHSGWYDTVWAYFAGCCLSVFKSSVLRVARAHYLPLLVAAIASFAAFYLFGSDRFAVANNWAGVSMMCVLLLATMKIRLDSRFLRWVGARVYPIYLYHTLLFLVARNVVSSPIGSYCAHMVVMASFGLSIVVASQWRRIAITLRDGRTQQTVTTVT